MNNTLPEDAKLQMTKGYAPRFDQISRLLTYVVRRTDASRVPKQDVMDAVGMSEHHVESLASLAAGMGLLVPVVYKPSAFGELVVRADPFFDDAGTLWVCHYQIASEERHVIWNRMANQILPEAEEPVTLDVAAQFDDLRTEFSEKSVKKHVPKELRAFFGAYTDYQLSELNYLTEVDGGYRLSAWPARVPDRVFFAITLLYRDRFRSGASGVEIPDLCHGSNSPGRLLNLSELRVREMLESLHRRGYLDIESRASLDQIRFNSELTALDVLGEYYAGS